MIITVVAAHARNYVIGDHGQIPWMGQFPEDMKHFRQLTEGPGKAVLMGRKTYESLPAPLRNRINIVMTRQKTYPLDPYVVRVENHAQAIRWAERNGIHKLFVIGGAEIYKEALSYADDIWVTTIDADYKGDAKFPIINQDEFHINMTHSMQADKLGTTCQFQYWVRNRAVGVKDAKAA